MNAQLRDDYQRLKQTWTKEFGNTDMALSETNRELETQRLELASSESMGRSGSKRKDQAQRKWKPTVVVTANGEVQTKEEAQSHVHDLGLFVTVQILEETPAVPSLPKKGRQLYAKRTISVTLVVPGLSTNSESVSSSTSTLQDLCPTNPAQERSDVQASGNCSGSPPKNSNPFF